jgi:hypothetical protein
MGNQEDDKLNEPENIVEEHNNEAKETENKEIEENDR